jgi:predicted RNase H-like HicB family nuclease
MIAEDRMIVYKAMFKFDEGGVHAQVLDFLGAVSCGADLKEARMMIASALEDMAETHILTGRPIPKPNPELTDPEADLEEPVYLLIEGASRVKTIALEARP